MGLAVGVSIPGIVALLVGEAVGITLEAVGETPAAAVVVGTPGSVVIGVAVFNCGG